MSRILLKATARGVTGITAAAMAATVIITVVVVTVALWPSGNGAPQVTCRPVPRKGFSRNELHWLDSASDASQATYPACIVSVPDEEVVGAPPETVVVRLPNITTEQVETRTGWKQAANDCPLATQDVQHAFGKEGMGRWTALTRTGTPTTCPPSRHEGPDEVVVQGQTAYDLFSEIVGNDSLSSYL